MNAEFQEWLEGFREEIFKRFSTRLKIITADDIGFTIEKITSIVSTVTGVSVEQMQSISRKNHIVDARYISMYLCRVYLSASLTRIGDFFKRDHTSVMHAVKIMKARIEIQERYSYPLYKRCNDVLSELFNQSYEQNSN